MQEWQLKTSDYYYYYYYNYNNNYYYFIIIILIISNISLLKYANRYRYIAVHNYFLAAFWMNLLAANILRHSNISVLLASLISGCQLCSILRVKTAGSGNNSSTALYSFSFEAGYTLAFFSIAVSTSASSTAL